MDKMDGKMKKQLVYSSKEAAEYLHISKSTLYELTKKGEIPSYRVGRNIKYSLEDLEQYLQQCHNAQTGFTKKAYVNTNLIFDNNLSRNGLVIGGQDLILDVLSNYLRLNGVTALRTYAGSFESLLGLYNDQIQVASAHLWAEDCDTYNIPFVQRLLPGIPAIVIQLVYRTQGFYVAKGNPKGIREWHDLARDDVSIINREKGAGSRVLLDGHLHRLHIDASQVNGYANETTSHLTAASAVGRGEADVGIGAEKISRQVENIDFIPVQKESYDLVVKKKLWDSEEIRLLMRIIRSKEFRNEFSGIGGYDVSDMGMILAEL